MSAADAVLQEDADGGELELELEEEEVGRRSVVLAA